MKKCLLLGAVVAVLASLSYFTEKSFRASPVSNPVVSETATNESPEATPPKIEGKITAPQAKTTTSTSTAIDVPKTVPVPAPNATLSVLGRLYPAFVPAGSSVIDVMRTLASTSDFTFTGHDYTSLGFFVESINGKKAESGNSWILYVNGTLSGTGASQTTLNAGDTIEWRYEENY